MALSDSFFSKVKKRTSVDKKTIVDLAEKLKTNGMKDEKTIREIIEVLSRKTGKNVSKEISDKIVSKIQEDKVPKKIDKMF